MIMRFKRKFLFVSGIQKLTSGVRADSVDFKG